MQSDHSFTHHHQSFRDSDTHKNIPVEGKENQLSHEVSRNYMLSPEEAARVIWDQWMLVRGLADTKTFKWEYPLLKRIDVNQMLQYQLMFNHP